VSDALGIQNMVTAAGNEDFPAVRSFCEAQEEALNRGNTLDSNRACLERIALWLGYARIVVTCLLESTHCEQRKRTVSHVSRLPTTSFVDGFRIADTTGHLCQGFRDCLYSSSRCCCLTLG
jgi:hypothetical protein